MILTKSEINSRINQGLIRIEPFNKKNVGPASYDLTLSNEFRVYRKGIAIDIKETADYKKFTKVVRVDDYMELQPGDFVLGITQEKISLPDNICAWLGGRSRFARLGIQVHITAAFIQPGISNKEVLELYNCSPRPIKLYPGVKICQLVFQETRGNASYEGIFIKQTRL